MSETNKRIAEFLDPYWEAHIPDFATDHIAAFTYLVPPLIELGFSIYHDKHAGVIVEFPESSRPSFTRTYAAALSAAFIWAMDNRPGELRKACEVTNEH